MCVNCVPNFDNLSFDVHHCLPQDSFSIISEAERFIITQKEIMVSQICLQGYGNDWIPGMAIISCIQRSFYG